MALDMLRQLSRFRLPATFHRTDDIDRIRILSGAGLIIAHVPVATRPALAGAASAAQVIAITEKGKDELAATSLPANPTSRPSTWALWRRTQSDHAGAARSSRR